MYIWQNNLVALWRTFCRCANKGHGAIGGVVSFFFMRVKCGVLGLWSMYWWCWCSSVGAHDFVKSIGKGRELGWHCIGNTHYGDGGGKPPQPLVICGPSRVGKGTLIGKLMQEFPLFGGFSMSPRHVNQGKRSEMVQEVHGNLYKFSLVAIKDVANKGKEICEDLLVWGFFPTIFFGHHPSCVKHSKCDYNKSKKFQKSCEICCLCSIQRHLLISLNFVMRELHTWHQYARPTNCEGKKGWKHITFLSSPYTMDRRAWKTFVREVSNKKNLHLHFSLIFSFVELYIKLIFIWNFIFSLKCLTIIKMLTKFGTGWKFGARGAWKPNCIHMF